MGDPLYRAGDLVVYYSKDYAPPMSEWLIDGLFRARTHMTLFAQSGNAKSFLGVDIACSISANVPFHGRAVQQAEVIYIAAEAPEEIHKRIGAWEQHHGVEANVLFMDKGVQIPNSNHMAQLTEIIRSRKGAVKLVIFDTLSRCMYGVKSKDADEVNTKVNAPIQALIDETGVAVLQIHHTGWDGGHERDSSALRDAVDLSFKTVFDKKTNHIRVQCEKNRRGANFQTFFLRPLYCERHDTLVLEAMDIAELDGIPRAPNPKVKRSPKTRVTNADKLASMLQAQPMSKRDLQAKSGLSESSFHDGFSRMSKKFNVVANDGILSIAA
jgi:hypothetical protein